MIRVVFEDDFLLVVDKPPGLVTTPAETVKKSSLADLLQADFGINLARGGLVHRLDKDTSGLILVAKDEKTLEALQNQFKRRQVKKQYLALVHGWVESSGKIEGNIGRNPKNREKFVVIDGERQGANVIHPRGGREAVTEYEPIKQLTINKEQLSKIFNDLNKIQMRKLDRMNYNQFTLVTCRPLTGRTHQIRVHLKYIGLPVVADQKYGGRKMTRLDNRWCPRMFLHAAKLEFTHPVSGEQMSLESPLPEDLRKALKILNYKN